MYGAGRTRVIGTAIICLRTGNQGYQSLDVPGTARRATDVFQVDNRGCCDR